MNHLEIWPSMGHGYEDGHFYTYREFSIEGQSFVEAMEGSFAFPVYYPLSPGEIPTLLYTETITKLTSQPWME